MSAVTHEVGSIITRHQLADKKPQASANMFEYGLTYTTDDKIMTNSKRMGFLETPLAGWLLGTDIALELIQSCALNVV